MSARPLHPVTWLSRVCIAAAAGAVAGAVAYVAVFAARPPLTLEMDQERSPLLGGFHEPERQGALSFTWTKRKADVSLLHLDRRQAWTCTWRVRAARPGGVDVPALDFAVDGATVRSAAATQDFSSFDVAVSPSPTNGLRLSIAVTPTFVAPPDTRALGVQVDSVACRPDHPGWRSAPPADIAGAAAAAAAWGAGAALAGLTAPWAVLTALVVAAAQALPLTAGAGPYAPYATDAVRLGLVLAGALVTVRVLASASQRRRLSVLARGAIVVSGAILYLKLLALLSVGKPVEDGLFHAHNFERVLAGQYFFVQTMPGGVQFPYAIALYLFALPWASFARNPTAHIALLRIIAASLEAVSGGLLYWVIARSWGDRVTAFAAVILFAFVPISFGIAGNTNLTNAFGQAAALVALALATSWPIEPRRPLLVAGLTLATATAFLSHFSVFAFLLGTLLVLTVAYWWLARPAHRGPARAIALAIGLATVIVVAGYYGRLDHFGSIYAGARTSMTSTNSTTVVAADAPRPEGVLPTLTAGARAAEILLRAADGLSWPLLVLAAVGAVGVARRRARDRLVPVLIALGVTYAVFVVFAVFVLGPAGVGYRRQAMEFADRALYGAAPAAAILGGAGCGRMWRAGTLTRVGAAALIAWAVAHSTVFWLAWFQ